MIANTPMALKVLASKLAMSGSALRFCDEAGPCGYGVQQQLTVAGHDCVVVAPSLIPRMPGYRLKYEGRGSRGFHHHAVSDLDGKHPCCR